MACVDRHPFTPYDHCRPAHDPCPGRRTGLPASRLQFAGNGGPRDHRRGRVAGINLGLAHGAALSQQSLLGFLVVLTAVTLVFVMVRISGDPTTLILPQDATEDERIALRHELGLDRPVLKQYLAYLGGAVHGEFGQSYFDGDTASAIIMRRLPNTLVLAGAALAVAVALAIPLGLMAAVWRGGLLDRAVQLISVIGVSTPSFWAGLLLIRAVRRRARMAADLRHRRLASSRAPGRDAGAAVFPAPCPPHPLIDARRAPCRLHQHGAGQRDAGIPSNRPDMLRNGIARCSPCLPGDRHAVRRRRVDRDRVLLARHRAVGDPLDRAPRFSGGTGDRCLCRGDVCVITVLAEIAVRIVNPRLRR